MEEPEGGREGEREAGMVRISMVLLLQSQIPDKTKLVSFPLFYCRSLGLIVSLFSFSRVVRR